MVWLVFAVCATALMYTHAVRWRRPWKLNSHAMWMGKPIVDLGNGHLYNIVQAIHRGYWLTTGNSCRVEELQRTRLLDEYATRGFDERDIVRFEERNTAWRDKHGNAAR